MNALKLSHEKGLNDSPMRCDLHPKWAHNGKLIAIDTIHHGHRAIHVYEN